MFWLLARYKPFGDYPSQSAGKYKSTRQGWSIILQNNISHSARLMKPTSQTLIKALLISSKFAKILNFIILPYLKPLGLSSLLLVFGRVLLFVSIGNWLLGGWFSLASILAHKTICSTLFLHYGPLGGVCCH
jgi:hypothetical protein